ncbi:MAG: tRNA (N6-threonylcarbamoyladenosine(37)-N6)-methyltransferase TrmO [Bacteroidales bacterium]|nr:tRNA (N6-threonylcarbamoyladenosine(37)-N6)-methyltransferase TrmO [Bacteroidales bacterium]
MNGILYQPIGIVHTPFTDIKDMPIQPSAAAGVKGYAEVYPEYEKGLKDLDGFSHIILIYHFHLSNGYRLEVRPFLDEKTHGVFATRAPRRPNNIGISVVQLVKIENNILHIENVDILDGTPLLDIKPFVPDFDAAADTRIGWLTGSKHQMSVRKSDGRFDIRS